MKTLALLSQKGGSGKTTLCLNLAIAATLQKKTVVVIDLDPQQSAARWARLRTSVDARFDNKGNTTVLVALRTKPLDLPVPQERARRQRLNAGKG